MANYIYRNSENDHIIDFEGVQKKTRVILRRARSKSSFGGCVTMSPLNVWILVPKQIFGLAGEDGYENIHVGGFGQGPFRWEDYNGDYYEMSVLDIEIVNKFRNIMSDIDVAKIMDWLEKITDLIQHINWFSNDYCFPKSIEECYTKNDTVCFYMEKIIELFSNYFSKIRKLVFT